MHSRFVKESLVVIVLAMAFAACQKPAPVQIPNLATYRDGLNMFSIDIPSDWQQSSEPGTLNLYNTQDAWNRFADPTSSSKPAVRIHVYAQSVGGETLQGVVEQFKTTLRQQQAEIDPDVQTMLAGQPATKIPYAVRINSKNTIYGFAILAVSDSNEYGYECQGFNKEFKRYTPVFDTVETTYRIIPRIVATQQLPDNLIPSSTVTTFSNNYFSISYPDNFKATPSGKNGDIETSVLIQGYFQDCNIEVDVLDAKKLPIDKVFAQNKGNYPNSKSEKITLDGLPAYVISYSPVRNIQRRVYFVVKNDKWIRVISTWNEASNNKYSANFPQTFQTAVASLKLK